MTTSLKGKKGTLISKKADGFIKSLAAILSGMLKDVQSGRKCEIDYVNGVVVKEGERVGVETPLCTKIVEMVHGIENGLYEIDYKNVDFFEI